MGAHWIFLKAIALSKNQRESKSCSTRVNFNYEATVSLMMHDQGRRQDVLKCPAELQDIMGRGQGYVGANDGQALRAWVDGAVQIDPAIEQARGKLLNVCEQGLEKFKAAWNGQTPTIRKALGSAFRDQCAASATAYDQAREAAHELGADPDPALDALNAAAQAAQNSAPAPAQAPAATQAATQAENSAVADPGNDDDVF